MLALWKNPDIKYDPHYKSNRKKTKSAWHFWYFLVLER
jgi:hypothetical protein